MRTTIQAEIRRLDDRLYELNHDDLEINRRVSDLVERLEDFDPDDDNLPDMFVVIRDVEMELKFIRDKQFVRFRNIRYTEPS